MICNARQGGSRHGGEGNLLCAKLICYTRFRKSLSLRIWGICMTVMLLAGKKVGEFEKNVNTEFENGLKISLTLEALLRHPAKVFNYLRSAFLEKHGLECHLRKLLTANSKDHQQIV